MLRYAIYCPCILFSLQDKRIMELVVAALSQGDTGDFVSLRVFVCGPSVVGCSEFGRFGVEAF